LTVTDAGIVTDAGMMSRGNRRSDGISAFAKR
jgi:hypothetical protein